MWRIRRSPDEWSACGAGGVCVHLCSDGWASRHALEKPPITENPPTRNPGEWSLLGIWQSRETSFPRRILSNWRGLLGWGQKSEEGEKAGLRVCRIESKAEAPSMTTQVTTSP